MDGGYYRTDLKSDLAVLSLNAQYMDIDDVTSYQGNEAVAQLAWLE